MERREDVVSSQPANTTSLLNKYYIIYYYNLHHASVALSRACMMMKQYFIHICICMQHEVAGIYICEMQLLTYNLFLCKIEISFLQFYFISFLFLFTNAVERTKCTTTLALVAFLFLNLFYF